MCTITRADVTTFDDLVDRQFGVFAAAQLRTFDVSRNSTARLVRRGDWVEIVQRVYALRHVARAMGEDARDMAALLACGCTSVLGPESAARRHRIWLRGSTDVVDVRTPEHLRRNLPPWIECRQLRNFDEADVLLHGPMQVLAPDRVICGLGDRLTPHQLAHVIERASYLRLADSASVARRLARGSRLVGAHNVRVALELVAGGSVGTRSRTEDRFLEIIGPLAHHALVNVRGATGLPGVECDVVWLDEQVVVEIDGEQHLRPVDAANDRLLDAALRAQGFTVIRIPSRDVWRRPAQVRRLVVEALSASVGTSSR